MIQIDHAILQHSKQLANYIYAKINCAGQISFAEFMQHALYAPGLGYYSAGCVKIGRDGDFITAPELGNLFAKCVARQAMEILIAVKAMHILELGAGSGKLAGDVLQELFNNGIDVAYYILEVSADLRQRQQDLILQQYPQFKDKIHWLDRLPDVFNGVILANEVMDAMPVARFHYANDQLQEYYVINNNDQYEFILDKPSDNLRAAFNAANLTEYISQPYTAEINLYLPAWLKSLSTCLNTGAILLFDYGFPRAEYYHPQRDSGTLMCHHQHRCHANPLINVGWQDITAHVDFTSVAEAAVDNQLSVGGYVNLTNFLLNCGITDFLTSPSIQQSQEINILTSPAEMGELFKCIALLQGVDMQLLGWQRYDKSHTL